MKKSTLLFLFIVLGTSIASAQTINNIPIKDIDVEYIEIVGTTRFLSDKVTIQMDFGQDTKFFGDKSRTVIKDKDGKKKIFNSMIDALNFMSENGYGFVQAYTITDGDQSVYHFLLRKLP